MCNEPSTILIFFSFFISPPIACLLYRGAVLAQNPATRQRRSQLDLNRATQSLVNTFNCSLPPPFSSSSPSSLVLQPSASSITPLSFLKTQLHADVVHNWILVVSASRSSTHSTAHHQSHRPASRPPRPPSVQIAFCHRLSCSPILIFPCCSLYTTIGRYYCLPLLSLSHNCPPLPCRLSCLASNSLLSY